MAMRPLAQQVVESESSGAPSLDFSGLRTANGLFSPSSSSSGPNFLNRCDPRRTRRVRLRSKRPCVLEYGENRLLGLYSVAGHSNVSFTVSPRSRLYVQ